MVALLAVPSHALLPLAARAPVHLRPSKAPRLAPVKLMSEEEAAAAPSKGLIARRLPILTWAPQLTSARIIGDIIAGLTVATVLIPQGMSYATVAGLNPIVGLYRHVLTRTGPRTRRLRAVRTKGAGQLAPWRHGCPCFSVPDEPRAALDRAHGGMGRYCYVPLTLTLPLPLTLTRYCYVPLLVYAAMGTSSFVSVGPVALVSTTLHGMIAYVPEPAAR